MQLNKFEFLLFKKIKDFEIKYSLQDEEILLNLQISGGRDSMCLLHAMQKVFNSKLAIFKNSYKLIAQHFNHCQRGQEADEDAFFVSQECLKLGIPSYLEVLQEKEIKKNKQAYFRNWRKKNAQLLSSSLLQKLNCTMFFIVTAHHAKDNVETLLLNILRGSGINGVRGINLLDDTKIYLRPFFDILDGQIQNYVMLNKIIIREDSSNLQDNYQRNYLRHNVLPHLQKLQNNYENSFLKLSQQAFQLEGQYKCYITNHTTTTELYGALKANYNTQDISTNCLKNILYEAKLILKIKSNVKKIIKLKLNRVIELRKEEDTCDIVQVSLYKAKL